MGLLILTLLLLYSCIFFVVGYTENTDKESAVKFTSGPSQSDLNLKCQIGFIGKAGEGAVAGYGN